MIGWPPKDFFSASLHEVWNAIDGFAEFNSDGKSAPMTKDEFEDLKELYPD